MAILTPASVFRKYVTDGVPDSGPHEPKKAEITQLLNSFFGSSRGGWVVALTLADLALITPPAETDGGVVLDDPNPAKNGEYARDTGAWVRGRGFPDTLALVTLSGPPNAQIGAVATGVDFSNILEFIATPAMSNTGPMTLTQNGVTKPVLNYAGNPMSAGEWATFVRYRDDGLGNFRLTIDANAASVASAAASVASTKRNEAEAFAALSGPTAVYSDTFTGTGAQTTFELPVAPTSAAHVWVAIDGVLQAPGTYTVDALNLMFSTAPPETVADNISYRIVSIADGEAVPPNGSVTKSKMAGSAVGDTEIDGTEGQAILSKIAAGVTAKTSLVDADTVLVKDSADTDAVKGITWANLKAGMLAYLQTAMANLLHQTGQFAYFDRATAPGGWIIANGGTIGNAASGGTTRANADTETLFTLIWNEFNQAARPVTTSAGGASTRGASAAADFAANKRILLADPRGRVMRSLDLSAGIDTGRALGSVQADALQGHWHSVESKVSSGGNYGWNGTAGAPDGTNGTAKAIVTDGVNGTPRIAAETRMTNYAALCCIKL